MIRTGHATTGANRASRLPRFVDNGELHGRWAYRRLFGRAGDGDGPHLADPNRTLHQFKRMHYCARQMKRLQERCGNRAMLRNDYKRFAALHQQFRDEIAADNLGLVYSLYKGTRVANVDGDELLSEGMMALTRAIDTFDPWRGFRFSTYACYAIIRAFYRVGLKEAKHRRHEPVHFDTELERGNWSDIYRAEESVLYAERLASILASGAVQLTPMEKGILARRFPLDIGLQSRTLADIGDEMSLSKERVRQIQNSALAKLRKALESDPVLNAAPRISQ
jgi:RNA polymerase sigma factor (sigma-70 family)